MATKKKKAASSKAPASKKPASTKNRPSKAKGVMRDYVFEDDGGKSVSASNTDRIIYPDANVTKGDILDYYRDVAEVMVPHLRGRAISLERFTKGIDKGGFFQKHYQSHYPEWIDRFAMGTKTIVEYPMCNDAASLVYFANQGGFAFHIGTDRKEAPGHPDQVVFDLDPPEDRFELAREAARAVRTLIEEVGLVPFVKTTGSKGLHVVVPLDAREDYDAVGAFLKRAATVLCERHPALLTMEFYKKDRKGRLYLDIMRNTLGATVVAAYSLRGKPGAPISAPITWDEVDDPTLRPNGFRLKEFRDRLATKGDPWADLYERAGSAKAALARLM